MAPRVFLHERTEEAYREFYDSVLTVDIIRRAGYFTLGLRAASLHCVANTNDERNEKRAACKDRPLIGFSPSNNRALAEDNKAAPS